jgi:hypothetical protein
MELATCMVETMRLINANSSSEPSGSQQELSEYDLVVIILYLFFYELSVILFFMELLIYDIVTRIKY